MQLIVRANENLHPYMYVHIRTYTIDKSHDSPHRTLTIVLRFKDRSKRTYITYSRNVDRPWFSIVTTSPIPITDERNSSEAYLAEPAFGASRAAVYIAAKDVAAVSQKKLG